MTWEQKLQAIQALGDTSLRMRHVGNWHVMVNNVSVKSGSLIRSSGGNGRSPEEAVEAQWKTLTGIADDEFVVVRPIASDAPERRLRWNGFMWADVL